jgi:hypothetical protein
MKNAWLAMLAHLKAKFYYREEFTYFLLEYAFIAISIQK